MIFYSNCKINIGLNVESRQEDGYHTISTIFYPVKGLNDAIEILPTQGETVFSSTGIEVDCIPVDNLCLRAYRCIASRHNIPNVKIHLHKNIPTGAGLGGGSANAATILKALNQMFELGLSNSTLISYANELGSDVAFFIENRPMIGEGRGGELSEIDLDLSGYWLSIVKPNCSMSTREAYSLIKPYKADFSFRDISKLDLKQWQEKVINDFEKPIFAHLPILQEIKDSLINCGGDYVAMSGSGSSIYAISKDEINLECFEGKYFCHKEKII